METVCFQIYLKTVTYIEWFIWSSTYPTFLFVLNTFIITDINRNQDKPVLIEAFFIFISYRRNLHFCIEMITWVSNLFFFIFRINSKYFDETSQFFYLLAKESENFLTYDDFEGLLQDIINTHPGLQFLLDAPEFHSRYIITVSMT